MIPFLDCIFEETRKKISILFKGLVNVLEVFCSDSSKVCDRFQVTHTSIRLYHNLSIVDNYFEITQFSDVKELMSSVLAKLPPISNLVTKDLEQILNNLKQDIDSQPYLIYFAKGDDDNEEISNKLKRIGPLMKSLKIGRVNCQKEKTFCSDWFIERYPQIVVFKPGGSYEMYHGMLTLTL